MNQTIFYMKKAWHHLALVIILFAITGQLFAVSKPDAINQQKITATGIVLDETGEPVPGVSVVEKEGNLNGTITDIDGRFSLSVDSKSTLVLSYIGYKTIEVAAATANNLKIKLQEDALNLDEVVVTGYTTQRKADLTGSVSVVKVDQIRSNVSGSAMRAIQGKVAGMAVSANGSPDASATIRIRGEGTLNNNDPLYIIDGTPTTRSMSELATMDIESIQVLKDASSASIYGSRAANGVIIITTRKGRKGTTVDFKASYTVTSSKNYGKEIIM